MLFVVKGGPFQNPTIEFKLGSVADHEQREKSDRRSPKAVNGDRQPRQRSCFCLRLFVPAKNTPADGCGGEKFRTKSVIQRADILGIMDAV